MEFLCASDGNSESQFFIIENNEVRNLIVTITLVLPLHSLNSHQKFISFSNSSLIWIFHLIMLYYILKCKCFLLK